MVYVFGVRLWGVEVAMIDVTVKVPEDRLGEFYSMYGDWLSGGVPMAERSADKSPWTASDVELASDVWSKFTEVARRLFSVLIDNPTKEYSGDQLAEMLSIANGRHGVAGVLAWPGRHCFDAGRLLPWSWKYPEENAPAVYWFSPEMAELFGKARADSAR